ncbi:peptidoglycan DD-metalloendopeptidase family protein [Streptomyces sp. C10-9-1]|uniref:peptidoglycan DD-metalloendopeptidase family protein n=1 Tax=Streptomyces sp. C10-9-1 TaxID=1859285 RepID=UPI0021130DE2|nr:peptidoglycan DD-metalloendopeptidase family protein [Streptomyces sp. C10-9-1]MCQ6554791.1 peptidoglycan DD-metalloendopeptidase family protein [Streptomyces sp. C10-9-1]
MPDLDVVGTAAVDVVPIAPRFHQKLSAIVLPAAQRVGEQAGRAMGDAIGDHIQIAIPKAVVQGGQAAVRAGSKQGDDTGGAFARSLRRKLQAAFKAMPKLDVKLGDTGVDAELARIRAKLEALSNKRIGIDVSAEAAEAEVARLEERLRRLGAAHPNIAVRADTATARAALAELRAEVQALTAEPGRIRMEVDGALGAKMRQAVAQAQASLPEINVDADTDPARAEIQSLRAQLATLSDQRIGIDIDAAEALTKLEAIQSRLTVIGAQSADIDVRVDTARAVAELAAVQALADDNKLFKITALADTSGATSALLQLGIQVAVLTAIPLGPALTAGLGAFTSMLATAGAGVGAFALASIPAIKGVGAALTAQTAAQEDADRAAQRGAASTAQAASRALQMAGAQASLASAHRNAARSVAQANRQVADAERALAQASQRASDQRRQAAESVQRAERSLADAKRDAQRAEDDLTDARRSAAQQLRDLNQRLEDGALDQRDAALRVREAQEELRRVMADPKATDLQRERAQLAADEAAHTARRQKQDYADLRKEAEKQRKAGVDGSDEVRDATERLASAQRKVRDEAKAVANAQRDAARTQVQAAQDVADAQRRVADAADNAANAQVAAAEAIAGAERGVAAARLSAISATSKAADKQEEYRKALAKLTPEQRALFDSIAGPQGIKTAFDEWQTSLQRLTLPIFTRAVSSAKASLPGLTPLAEGAAAGIQTLMDKASQELQTPFWQSFKADLSENVQPAVEGFGIAFGNVIKGIAGIIDAFLPHMDGIARKSDGITARFATWGSSLKGSPEFERFLQYVKDTAPGLASFLGDVFGAMLDVSQALSPLSEIMFETLGPLFDAISWLAENMPEVVQLIWGLWAAQKAITLGMAAYAGAMALYESVTILAAIATSGWAVALNATGIVPIIRAIVTVLGILVAAVIYAYNNWDWFRETVDTVAGAIGSAISAAWNGFLKPAFDGIWWAMKKVGDIAVELWEEAIRPSFDFIATAAKYLLTGLVVLVLTPIYLAFKALGAIALWLWKKAISPSFDWIADGAKWLWNKVLSPIFGWIGDKATWLYNKAIKPAFDAAVDAFDALSDAGEWMWKKVLSPIFGWIGDKATWLYNKAIKPAFDNIKRAVKSVSDSFKTGRDVIGEAWNKVRDIAKKPVKFIIDKIYNGAIVPLWNKVAGITGAGKLRTIDSAKLDAYNTGGIVPGYTPGVDNHIIAVGGGESIMRPEVTRAVGASRINSLNSAARQGGVGAVRRLVASGMPAFKDGGIVDWLKDKTNAVGEFVSGAVDFLHPTKVFGKAKQFITGQLKNIMTNPFAREVASLPGKILSGLKNKALDLVGFGGNGGGGSWLKPVNAAYGTPFGKRGSMWRSGRHTGLDFPAAVGTAIRAVAGGRISQAAGGGPYGNHVMINHGNGLASLYAHMSSMATAVGKTVRQGQTIGRVGATGNVTGPHLHLEARVNGKTVDPMAYLAGGGSGGKGVQRWRSVVQRALSMTGNPVGYADLTLRRMNQESGGNPRAVNNWDINARNGTPSVGLMQVIRPTFDAYAGTLRGVGPKLYGVSVDPLANIYSSMRYAMARYGSLPRAYTRPGGYASGGFPSLGELAWVGENGPELVRFLHPAQVYSSRDSMSMARAAQGLRSIPATSAAPTVHVEARVFVGDREITDIVRTEITTYDEETAAAVSAGRWA